MRQLIFVVDGEIEVCQVARQCLEEAGYAVQTFPSGDVMAQAEDDRPQLMLISLMLPEGSGLTLCRRIREHASLDRTPVVFLLAEAVEEHRILALECGGDDCIVKPFSPRELVARVQAVLRRLSPVDGLRDAQTAELVIDSWAMRVSVRGSEVPTTSLEFRLIEYLARHRGQVFTRDLLLDAVWGDMQFVTPRSVDACIRRIRGKIEPDRSRPTYLKTIRGVGYRLDALATWQSTPSEGCDCIACTSAVGASQLSYVSSARRRRASVQVKN
ncbi:MAG: response regulator transcription factor [Terriglobales bacterium]|jgi:DNA-binding response OmpR family regulator